MQLLYPSCYTLALSITSKPDAAKLSRIRAQAEEKKFIASTRPVRAHPP